ncbi:uncharacterized mitochondrial protein AtMg00810-like [Impatiens glandulifera]|uniref:uncharacterized mitochondrial protein AtMg00810-like n=1 Tax=Impatiens glandulifera TaxID=253017 RepID=UPI001FB05F31|nr:uncharacterized mitochondrial protein AtMg00810-like [Impatiens glandulifera]
MENCNSRKYLMEEKLHLRKDVEGSLVDPKEYRHIVGCLGYLMHTQPDISYVVGIVSRYMEQPTTLHQQVVKHILLYMKGTKSYRIQLRKGREVEELVSFTNSDLASDTNDRKSAKVMVFYLNGNLITYYCSIVPRTLAEKLVERGARMRAETGNPLCRQQVCNIINEEPSVSWMQQTH